MPPPPIIFILGLHRTGTTVLYQLLAETGGFEILTAADVVGFSRVAATSADWNGEVVADFAALERAGHTSRGIDAIPLGPGTPEEYGFVLSNWHAGWSLTQGNVGLFREMCGVLRRRSVGRPLLVKNPWDFGNASWIRSQFPDARFVFLHRDPRETLSSTLRMMLAYLNHRNPYLAILSASYRRFIEAGFPFRVARWVCVNHADWIVRAALWHSARRAARYLRERPLLPQDRCYDLRFDDLCADPRGSLNSLFAFLHVDADSTTHAAQVKRPPVRIAPEVVRHEVRIRRAFAKYARQLGYDLGAPLAGDEHPR